MCELHAIIDSITVNTFHKVDPKVALNYYMAKRNNYIF